jgi:hypothetical protein
MKTYNLGELVHIPQGSTVFCTKQGERGSVINPYKYLYLRAPVIGIVTNPLLTSNHMEIYFHNEYWTARTNDAFKLESKKDD